MGSGALASPGELAFRLQPRAQEAPALPGRGSSSAAAVTWPVPSPAEVLQSPPDTYRNCWSI